MFFSRVKLSEYEEQEKDEKYEKGKDPFLCEGSKLRFFWDTGSLSVGTPGPGRGQGNG